MIIIIIYLILTSLLLGLLSSIGKSNKEYEGDIHKLYRQEKWKKDNKIY